MLPMLPVAAMVLAVTMAGQPGDRGPMAATLSAQAVRDRLGGIARDVRAWCVEYETTRDRTPRLRGPSVHRQVACRAPDQFAMWTRKSSHLFSWERDPFQERLVISGTLCVGEMVATRARSTFELPSGAPLPGSLPADLLFLALGWWSLENRPAPLWIGGAPMVLRDVAADNSYTVRPTQEYIGGHWCHVLEHAGRDRMWVHCGERTLLVRREAMSDSGTYVAESVDAWDHKEVAPGLWAPLCIRHLVYGAPSEGGPPPTAVDAEFRLVDVQVGEIEDALFAVEKAPGLLEQGADGIWRQSVPGGRELLDQYAERLFEVNSLRGPETAGSRLETVVEFGFILVCACAGGFRSRYRRRTLQRAPRGT